MSPTIKNIPFARPSLGPEEEEAVLRVMRSGWLTTGSEAEAFEREFAERAGVAHAVALSSATAGLHLGLEALGVQEGEFVAMSPYTFAATAEVTRYLGAHPLFVDIDPETLNIDARQLDETLSTLDHTRRVRVVLPVHIGGVPSPMHEIRQVIANQRHSVLRAASDPGDSQTTSITGNSRPTLGPAAPISILEDAAHVSPSVGGDRLGTMGEVGVFSFYANKPITTGEGGMLCTHNAEIAQRVRLMRLHGIDRQVWDRYRSVGAGWRYEVVEAGYKYNMPDLLAAIGRVQLRRTEELRRRRSDIAMYYNQALCDTGYLRPPADNGNTSHHLYILRLIPEHLKITRDEFIARLNELGVGTSVHYIPLHIMPYYRRRYGLKPTDFPEALRAFEWCISLPIYPDLTDEEREYVVRAVRLVGDAAYQGKGA
jgi:dTDP-4-amino-4,6-dideoxygalactose transaminase